VNYLNSDYSYGGPQSKYIFAFRGRPVSPFRASALHGLTCASPPAGVSMYLDCSEC